MRTNVVWLALLVVGCSGKDGSNGDDTPPGDSADADTDTDTDADTDSDSDTDSDTDSPGDTATTGRVPGCAPEWPVPPDNFVNCSSVSDENDLIAGRTTTTITTQYDGQGRVAVRDTVDHVGNGTRTETYTYDATTGLVASVTIDYGDNGTIDETDTYTTAVDGSGNPTSIQVDTSLGTTSLVTQTWGSCGIETQAYDHDNNGTVDESVVTTYFTDGLEVTTDEGNDGSIEDTFDFYADPSTGLPISTEEELNSAHQGPENETNFNTFDVNNRLTNSSGYESQSGGITWDFEKNVTWDANGRVSTIRVDYTYSGNPAASIETDTSWSCP